MQACPPEWLPDDILRAVLSRRFSHLLRAQPLPLEPDFSDTYLGAERFRRLRERGGADWKKALRADRTILDYNDEGEARQQHAQQLLQELERSRRGRRQRGSSTRRRGIGRCA